MDLKVIRSTCGLQTQVDLVPHRRSSTSLTAEKVRVLWRVRSFQWLWKGRCDKSANICLVSNQFIVLWSIGYVVSNRPFIYQGTDCKYIVSIFTGRDPVPDSSPPSSLVAGRTLFSLWFNAYCNGHKECIVLTASLNNGDMATRADAIVYFSACHRQL